MSEDTVDRRALAVELLGSKRPPLLVIWCGGRDGRHKIGAVYDTGATAGRVVAMRPVDLPPDFLPKREKGATLEAYAYGLDDGDDDDVVWLGGCQHGLYHVHPVRLREWLTRRDPSERGAVFTASWSTPPTSGSGRTGQ